MKEILILALILIPLASAVNSERICDKTFYFFINNPNSKNIANLKYNLNISLEELKPYFYNYSDICPKKLPYKRNFDKLNINKTVCNLDVNKRVLFDSIDLNSSIDFNFINLLFKPDKCNIMRNLKWFIDINQTEEGFEVIGLRTWVLFSSLLLIVTITLIKSTKLTNEVAKKYIRGNS